ncbi:MAG TPA: hypothetical protein VJA40_05195 [archaeon]|nr:hypothetical protein [archaeon]
MTGKRRVRQAWVLVHPLYDLREVERVRSGKEKGDWRSGFSIDPETHDLYLSRVEALIRDSSQPIIVFEEPASMASTMNWVKGLKPKAPVEIIATREDKGEPRDMRELKAVLSRHGIERVLIGGSRATYSTYLLGREGSLMKNSIGLVAGKRLTGRCVLGARDALRKARVGAVVVRSVTFPENLNPKTIIPRTGKEERAGIEKKTFWGAVRKAFSRRGRGLR